MVQGKGYNYPKIVGTVIAVREGESCTLDVAFVTATTLPNTISHEDLWKYTGIGKQIAGSPAALIETKIEHGDTKCFTKVFF
jgi:hypothetical protein